MFLQTATRAVNLQNVSNINILNNGRIVFNMNYSIEILYFDKAQRKEKKKFISDYVYWDSYDSTDLADNIDQLKSQQYFKDNFIEQLSNGYINKNEISSIKYAENKHRVIFNLSHPVTFTDFDGEDKLTSEFVYVNCEDFEQFNSYIQYIETELNLR